MYSLFFTTEKRTKILLIAYEKNNRYTRSNCDIDFSDMNIKVGTKYILRVGKSKNKRTKWIDAEILIEGC